MPKKIKILCVKLYLIVFKISLFLLGLKGQKSCENYSKSYGVLAVLERVGSHRKLSTKYLVNRGWPFPVGKFNSFVRGSFFILEDILRYIPLRIDSLINSAPLTYRFKLPGLISNSTKYVVNILEFDLLGLCRQKLRLKNLPPPVGQYSPVIHLDIIIYVGHLCTQVQLGKIL